MSHPEDEENVDPEWPDESDMDADEDDPTIPCPFCKSPIHEETEICHHCGSFVGGEDDRSRMPSPLVILIVGLVLASLAIWLFRL